jgi:hypothetical protein
MGASEETKKGFQDLLAKSEALKEIEETIMQTSSLVMADKALPSTQRIQLSNSLVQASANTRNCITQIETVLTQAKSL